MPGPEYTIGHSNHSFEFFVGLLDTFGIETVADVRSQPGSRRFPWFSYKSLKRGLQHHGIDYLFLGNLLGARRMMEDSAVRRKLMPFAMIAMTTEFASGLEKIVEIALCRKVCIMCAEKDPMNCHRALLVSRHLVQAGCQVLHIHSDSSLESHDDFEKRLLKHFHMDHPCLFSTRQECLDAVYLAAEKKLKRGG